MAAIKNTSSEKHEGDAMSVVYWKNHIFSAGIDGKIKIWDNDLNLIKTVDAHDAYIYAMAVNSNNGKVYSSSSDGCVKFMMPPYDKVDELVRCDDAIQSMCMNGDILYTGDEKGVVTNWKEDKMLFKFNLVEEVKSLAAEDPVIFTVRDNDVVVSHVVAGKSGKYTNKAVFPGKSPLALVGPIANGRRTLLVFADRSGKGLIMFKNLPDLKLKHLWSNEDCHEMIINSICGNEKFLYSGGYDCKVKAWANIDEAKPTPLGEVDAGSWVNSMCCGADDIVYIAISSGSVISAKFIQ